MKNIIIETLKSLDAGETTAVEIANTLISVEKATKHMNAYIYFNADKLMQDAYNSDKQRQEGKRGLLSGIPVAIKDNIVTADMPTTCASNMLRGYRSPTNAKVVDKLIKSGALISGKVNLDEFAMGSTSGTSAFGRSCNPYNISRISGGSSGGSAVAVATGSAYASLGSDTGGSIRLPASYCGITAIKPTYGRISRQGLFPLTTSLDQIGVFTKTVEDNQYVLQAVCGFDKTDVTSESKAAYKCDKLDLNTRFKVAVLADSYDEGVNDDVRIAISNVCKHLSDNGFSLEVVTVPYMNQISGVYSTLCCAEAAYNLSKFDGKSMGNNFPRTNLFEGAVELCRGEFFGTEVKARMMFGKYVVSGDNFEKYYIKACQIRTLIIEFYKNLFSQYDIVINPTAPTTAPSYRTKLTDDKIRLADNFAIIANLTGMPALTIPCGSDADGLPIGIQFMGRKYCETDLYNIANFVEKTYSAKYIADFNYEINK